MLNVINDFCSVFRAVLMQCGATIILIFNIIICATVGKNTLISFKQTHDVSLYPNVSFLLLQTQPNPPPTPITTLSLTLLSTGAAATGSCLETSAGTRPCKCA